MPSRSKLADTDGVTGREDPSSELSQTRESAGGTCVDRSGRRASSTPSCVFRISSVRGVELDGEPGSAGPVAVVRKTPEQRKLEKVVEKLERMHRGAHAGLPGVDAKEVVEFGDSPREPERCRRSRGVTLRIANEERHREPQDPRKRVAGDDGISMLWQRTPRFDGRKRGLKRLDDGRTDRSFETLESAEVVNPIHPVVPDVERECLAADSNEDGSVDRRVVPDDLVDDATPKALHGNTCPDPGDLEIRACCRSRGEDKPIIGDHRNDEEGHHGSKSPTLHAHERRDLGEVFLEARAQGPGCARLSIARRPAGAVAPQGSARSRICSAWTPRCAEGRRVLAARIDCPPGRASGRIRVGRPGSQRRPVRGSLVDDCVEVGDETPE